MNYFEIISARNATQPAVQAIDSTWEPASLGDDPFQQSTEPYVGNMDSKYREPGSAIGIRHENAPSSNLAGQPTAFKAIHTIAPKAIQDPKQLPQVQHLAPTEAYFSKLEQRLHPPREIGSNRPNTEGFQTHSAPTSTSVFFENVENRHNITLNNEKAFHLNIPEPKRPIELKPVAAPNAASIKTITTEPHDRIQPLIPSAERLVSDQLQSQPEIPQPRLTIGKIVVEIVAKPASEKPQSSNPSPTISNSPAPTWNKYKFGIGQL